MFVVGYSCCFGVDKCWFVFADGCSLLVVSLVLLCVVLEEVWLVLCLDEVLIGGVGFRTVVVR